jgi:flagella synthesis protein FlgN
MTRQDAMKALLLGIAQDQQAYDELAALLQQQFEATIRHQNERLGQLAETISALVDRMQERRAQRVALAQRLLGPQATIMQAFSLLKNTARERMEGDWKALEIKVIECKRLGKRNSDLLVEQYSIMQRVLHGEELTYAPA